MAKKILTTPIQKSDLEGIKPGDVIYLTGHITTSRDMGHRRVVEEGKTLPVDVKDGAILHAGPIIRTISDNEFEVVSVVLLHLCVWKNSNMNLLKRRGYVSL